MEGDITVVEDTMEEAAIITEEVIMEVGEVTITMVDGVDIIIIMEDTVVVMVEAMAMVAMVD